MRSDPIAHQGIFSERTYIQNKDLKTVNKDHQNTKHVLPCRLGLGINSTHICLRKPPSPEDGCPSVTHSQEFDMRPQEIGSDQIGSDQMSVGLT